MWGLQGGLSRVDIRLLKKMPVALPGTERLGGITVKNRDSRQTVPGSGSQLSPSPTG